jgi:SAM-dependent methyltransferase
MRFCKISTNNMEKKYFNIVSHYESCLDKYGDTHRGVDWPNLPDAEKRYQVMIALIKPFHDSTVSLLDFGCGASHLYEYMRKHGKDKMINYFGLDISDKFIELSKQKFPWITYHCLDILRDPLEIPNFDYIVMNGVFTEKINLSFEEMFCYFKEVIKKVFSITNIGIAFNIMSKHVDWERQDLFHLPLDMLAEYLTKEVSRNYIIRNDYGLYEYTTYVYK